MSRDNAYDIDLLDYRFSDNVREGIDLTDDEVRKYRLAINASMAEMKMEPAERAHLLHILGLAYDDEFKPEYRPDPPTRLCDKKLHNIADPSNYRIRKVQSMFGGDRICLACERKSKADAQARIAANRAKKQKNGSTDDG